MTIRSFFKLKRYKIGNTPLIRCEKLEELYGFTNLLIKDESDNHFGTFKDRRNRLIVEDAMKRRVDKLALITSGNSGYSLAKLAERIGVKVVCIIDEKTNHDITKHLEKYSQVVKVDLSKKIFYNKDVIGLAREEAEEVIWDVTNGYDAAFQSIIKEIKKEDPDWLITPVGGGEAYVGLYEGLKKYRMKTKLVGAGVHRLRNNRLELFGGPSIADKLYTPYMYTRYKEIIEISLKEGHLYIQVSEEQIKDAHKRVSSIISCEPSSAAAFAALSELDVARDSKIIVINSGKGTWGS